MSSDPLCACGHPKSDHYKRFNLGQVPEHLECEVQLEVMLNTEEVRHKRCRCRWFRLALSETES